MRRDRVFAMKVTDAEHGLLHAAAKLEGFEDSTSEWARSLLLREARRAFRGALEEANEAAATAPAQRRLTA